MSEKIENAHEWVDAAIRDTGMVISGKHPLGPRQCVVIASVQAHEAYLWGKANQAISITSQPQLQKLLYDYTRILLGPEPETGGRRC